MINTDDILPLKRQLGYIIQQERERQILTISELSQLSETARSQLLDVEDGTSHYTIDTFLRVIVSMGCNIIIINEKLEAYEPVGDLKEV